MSYRTVIDCDTGVDDALALLAAVGSPALDIEFVTTVAGNAPLEQTTENTLRVLALAGRPDIPVYRGAERPLARNLVTGSAMHGTSGLAGMELPPSPAQAGDDAASALAAWCAEPSDWPKRLIAIAPLTNLGALLASDPNALAGIDQLFIMGGSLSGKGGALSPRAETNFFIDPEAARLVLNSGIPISLYDYDATTACLLTPEQIDTITAQIPAEIAPFVGAWLEHLYQSGRERFGRQGVAAHDLYAVAGAAGVPPGRWERYLLDVEVSDSERGVVRAEVVSEPAGINVARDIDPEAMVAFLIDCLRKLR